MEKKQIAISLNNINKSYSATTVFKALNWEINCKDRVLLIGANGSGKSTLLKLMAGISKPDQGEIINNIKIAYSNYEYGFYDSLTVLENYQLFLDLSDVTLSATEELKKWGLFKYKDYEVSKLSSGLKQRLNLAKAFSLKSNFLLLDEPTAFLDKEGINIFTQILKENIDNNQLSGFIIATHDIAILKQEANRILLLDTGKIIADDTEVEKIITSYLHSD